MHGQTKTWLRYEKLPHFLYCKQLKPGNEDIILPYCNKLQASLLQERVVKWDGNEAGEMGWE